CPTMQPPSISEADFAVLVARAGLAVPAPQRATLHAVWGAIEAMQASVRTPPPGVAPLSAPAAAVEPAVTFSAERG
ncbi:MAG: hypothetical protein K2X74_17160, partial [Acetobacteraceae bacterium]|nr:hypothetical protein [Acetobacteraceae bacterium]